MNHLKYFFQDLIRFSTKIPDPICQAQGMKEYKVDLVMMNGGDIRGVDGWFLAGSNPLCFRFQRIHQKLNWNP